MNYGLLGEKLPHSFSPQIHKLLGNEEYGLFEKRKEELPDFLKKGSWKAINVTIPYKQAVIPYLDSISALAKAIGSVNTVVRAADGSLCGFNTDYGGLCYALLSRGLDPARKKVLVLGSGGTSLTAQYAVKTLGAAETVVISRSGENHYGNLEKHADAELLINTTPVGMFPHNGEAPVLLSRFPKLYGVMDVIYNPFRTVLLQEAKKRGLSYVNGLPMLAAQAKYASELFFTKEAETAKEPNPVKVFRSEIGMFCAKAGEGKDAQIEKICTVLSGGLSNIVLIGMPSCGKTTVGALLSKKIGKAFFDSDAELEKAYGKTIPQIFEEEGEAGFRRKEAEIVKLLSGKHGAVISCGGGVVLSEENCRALGQNGSFVFLKRPVSLLSTEGRPLSKDIETLKRMYELRLPLYEKYAELTVENTSTPEVCAEEIAAYFQTNA